MCRWWSSDVRGFRSRCTDSCVISPPQRYLPSSEPTHPATYCRYCLPVWARASGSQLNCIPKLLHFAARVATGARRAESKTPILRSLGWLNIEDVISEHDCIRAFPALNDPDTPSALRRLFIQTCLFRQGTASRDTRLARSYQLHLPRVRLAATQRTSSYCAANSWNSLLETVLQSSIG